MNLDDLLGIARLLRSESASALDMSRAIGTALRSDLARGMAFA